MLSIGLLLQPALAAVAGRSAYTAMALNEPDEPWTEYGAQFVGTTPLASPILPTTATAARKRLYDSWDEYAVAFRTLLGRDSSTVNELVALFMLLLAMAFCAAIAGVLWLCGRALLRRLPHEAVFVGASAILVCFVQTYGEGALPSYFPTSPEGRSIGLTASGRILGAFPLATLIVSVGDFDPVAAGAAGARSLSAFLASGGLTTYLIRRLGPRTVVCIGLVIGAAGSFAFGFTPDVLRSTGAARSLLEPLLMLWRLVSGAGTCLAQVSAFVLIDTVEGLAAHRGLAIALTEVGFWGSMLCGSFLGSYAYVAGEALPAFSSFLPFSSAMTVPSLAAVALQLIALRLVWSWLDVWRWRWLLERRFSSLSDVEKREEGAADAAPAADLKEDGDEGLESASSVWTPDRLVVLFSVFLNAVAVGGTFGILGVELASPPTSLHAGEVGSVFTAMSAARMLASPVVGMLLDRWRGATHAKTAVEKDVIAAGWALYAAAFVLLSFATTLRESALLATNLAMIGVGVAGTVVQTPSRLDLERGVAASRKGAIVAVWNAAYACGMVVGPTALSAAFGPLGFQRSILTVAGVSALMCVAMQLFASRERDVLQSSGAITAAPSTPRNAKELERHIAAVSWTFYSGQALDFIYIFSIVPVSYDLAQHLSDGLLQPAHATVLSGFLISTTFIGELFGVIGATPLARLPYVQKNIRSVVLGCQLFVLFSWLGFVFFACAPWMFGFRILGNVTRIAVLLACRGIAGIAMASRHVLSRVMVLRWLPPSRQVSFTILDNAIKSLSMGVGPLWASAVTALLLHHGVSSAGNEPLVAAWITLSLTPFVVIWLGVYVLLVPSTEPPINEPAAEPTLAAEPPPVADDSSAGLVALVDVEEDTVAKEKVREAAKRKLWLTAMSVGFERAWVVAGLEVATALILNLEFGVAVVDNGLLIGGTFIASSLFALPTLHAKQKKWLSDTQLLTITQAMVVFFTCLLFDGVGDLFNLSSGGRLALLLFADMGLYSVAYTGHGILKGLVMAHPSRAEGTIFTPVNHILLNELSAAFARFLSAPTARYLVQAGGRNLYATVQLAIATFSFISALLVVPQILIIQPRAQARLGKSE